MPDHYEIFHLANIKPTQVQGGDTYYQLCIYQFPVRFYVLGGMNSLVKSQLTFVSRLPFSRNVMNVKTPNGGIHIDFFGMCSPPDMLIDNYKEELP